MMNKVNLVSLPIMPNQIQNKAIGNQTADFSSVLKNALNNISKMEKEADVKRELLATNRIEDLHDVMITAQKASITVEAAVQIQQKVIDAYNEIMRMQI